MATYQVEANQLIPFHLSNFTIEVLKDNLVIACIFIAEFRVIFWFDFDVRNSVADTFAAAISPEPFTTIHDEEQALAPDGKARQVTLI